MIKFLKYNWQVRDEWFEWCEQLTLDELLNTRVGGVCSILYTLFHIIDVEYSWIRGIQGKGDLVVHFENYKTPERLKTLSDEFRKDINEFLEADINDIKDKVVKVPWDDEAYTADEIFRHIIAHEIHHIGQLSIWSRELGLKPPSANFIGRNIT